MPTDQQKKIIAISGTVSAAIIAYLLWRRRVSPPPEPGSWVLSFTEAFDYVPV